MIIAVRVGEGGREGEREWSMTYIALRLRVCLPVTLIGCTHKGSVATLIYMHIHIHICMGYIYTYISHT